MIPGGALATPTLNAFVYDHTTNAVYAYLNGTLVNTVNQTSPSFIGSIPFKVNGYDNRIGAPAGGLLDEFRLYNRALSAAEITSLLNVSVSGTDIQSSCGSYTWIDGNTYTASTNTPTHTIPAGAGHTCDSVVTLNLTILNPATSTATQSACNSYTWIDGNTYTSSNNTATYNYVGGAANGCDSIVTLDLTIHQNETETYNITECDSYTWIDGNTYTSSISNVTYNKPGATAAGCDSIFVLNLTINQTAFSTDVQSACVSYTWIDGNTYTSDNNTATYTIPAGAANGCDSVIQLDLTIDYPATGVDVQHACGSYTWINGTTYTANNNSDTYTYSGMAANGCDSVVLLNLTLTQIDSSVNSTNFTLTSNQNGALYQWLDCNNGNSPITNATNQNYTPGTSGSYAVQIFMNGCTSTSNCYPVVISGLSDHKNHATLPVYPNPTDDIITISLKELSSAANIRLFNLEGKLIQEHANISQDNFKMSLKNYEHSIYFLVVTSENFIYNLKVVKL
jgi:hypothetical protein